jgi:hypothetical protein
MKVTKEEFNEFWDLYKLRCNVEVIFKFSFLGLENWTKENYNLSNYSGINPILKEKYEMKLINKPESLLPEEITEEITGLSKEKVIYIEENFRELMNKYK